MDRVREEMELSKSSGTVAGSSATTVVESRSPIRFQTMTHWDKAEHDFVVPPVCWTARLRDGFL